MKEQYDSYKDSGIPWIGQVPQRWEVDELGRHFRERRTKVSDKEYEPLSVSKHGITPQLDTACKTDNGDNRKLVCKGDFVVNSRSDRKGSCGLSDYDGSVSLINTVLEPIDMDGKYCHYLFRSNDYVEEFYRLGRGIVADLWTTRYDDMKVLKIPLPPLPEQRAIAGYLDARCAAIDAYVASLEREAGLARELKQAVIARAVTRGLDPNAPMRDSGIPWIGQVPQRWEVDELGRHFRERRTKVSDKEYEPLSVSKHGITPQLDTACKTDNGDNRKLVCKGDFVVNSRSDRKGSCGLSDYDGSVSLINTVLEPIDMDGKYCHYLFRSNDYVEEFYRLGRGIVADLWTTRYDDMKVLKIPLPPLPEQRAIAGYLDARCAAIDVYVASLEREAALARELKQREIADAVTGKVKITA